VGGTLLVGGWGEELLVLVTLPAIAGWSSRAGVGVEAGVGVGAGVGAGVGIEVVTGRDTGWDRALSSLVGVWGLLRANRRLSSSTPTSRSRRGLRADAITAS
jgi:hypothetical protein